AAPLARPGWPTRLPQPAGYSQRHPPLGQRPDGASRVPRPWGLPRPGKNAGIDVPRASGEQVQIEGSREPLAALDQAKWLYLILEQNRGRRVGALRSVDLVHAACRRRSLWRPTRPTAFQAQTTMGEDDE